MAITGEVMTDEEVKAKKEQEKKTGSPFAVGSYITKSNDLIQKTKYSLPRNEQKILFMLLSKIDQKNDTDASKYYTITFSDFSKLTGVNAESRPMWHICSTRLKIWRTGRFGCRLPRPSTRV